VRCAAGRGTAGLRRAQRPSDAAGAGPAAARHAAAGGARARAAGPLHALGAREPRGGSRAHAACRGRARACVRAVRHAGARAAARGPPLRVPLRDRADRDAHAPRHAPRRAGGRSARARICCWWTLQERRSRKRTTFLQKNDVLATHILPQGSAGGEGCVRQPVYGEGLGRRGMSELLFWNNRRRCRGGRTTRAAPDAALLGPHRRVRRAGRIAPRPRAAVCARPAPRPPRGAVQSALEPAAPRA
jgi:hypothetical protein